MATKPHDQSPPGDNVVPMKDEPPALFGPEFDLSDLPDREVPPTSFLVPGWLAAEGAHILFSDEGKGKSLEACRLGAIVAMPKTRKAYPYLGVDVEGSGRVLMLMGEGTANMHEGRMKAIIANNLGLVDKAKAKVVTSRIRMVCYASLDLKQFPYDSRVLFTKGPGNTALPTPHLLGILKMLRLHQQAHADNPFEQFRLLMVDTLQGMFGLDIVKDDLEMNSAMFWLIRELNALGISLVIIAHTNKDSDDNADDHRGALKGSQQVQATVMQTLYMRGPTDQEFKLIAESKVAKHPRQIVCIRVGKTNLKDPFVGVRIMRKIPDGAPEDVTDQCGGAASVEVSIEAIVQMVRLMTERDAVENVTNNKVQSFAEGTEGKSMLSGVRLVKNGNGRDGKPRRGCTTYYLEVAEARGAIEKDASGWRYIKALEDCE